MSALAVLALIFGLYWHGKHVGAARERPKTQAALARAAVSCLETQGARDSLQRVEVVVRQREAAAASVAKLIPEALNAEDADAPLSPDRADRLHAADRELCQSRPELAGCPESGDSG